MFPYITPLPPAPSRVGDPNNFLAESDVFLSSYPLYVSEVNATSIYLNGIPLNVNNWGDITQINPTYIEMHEFGPLAQAGDSGSVFASKHDAFLASMELISYDISDVVDFMERLAPITGASPVTDLDRQIIPNNLGLFPRRSDTVIDFENKSINFYSNVKQNAELIKRLHDYAYKAISPEDNGLLNQTVDEVINFGLISEGI